MATPKYRSVWVLTLFCAVSFVLLTMWGYNNSRAVAADASPVIDRENTLMLGSGKNAELVIAGNNFQSGMFMQMESSLGVLAKGDISIESPQRVVVHGLTRKDFPDGVATITVRNPGGVEVKETIAILPSAIGPSPLTTNDIQQIIAQGVSAAIALNRQGTFVVLDREANILAIYQMKGAPKNVVVRDIGTSGQGLEGTGAIPAVAAAISKAGVGSFFGTQGNAFSTRSAAWIIRENIPPFIKNRVSGPLFGVQISSLGCSDVKQPGLPLGLSGDTGGFPIYKNGVMAGGFGVELNGQYNVALNRPEHFARPINGPSSNTDEKKDPALYEREGIEEIVGMAALQGFLPPSTITGDKILVDGIRLPYVRQITLPSTQTLSFRQLPGKLLPIPGETTARIRTGVQTEFRDIILRDRPVRVVNRFFPFKNGKNGVTASDVEQMLFQGVKEANRTRAAIRQPLDVPAEVNISMVDSDGTVLGIVSTPDAPVFGFDVSVEKGRSAVLFSRADAAQILRSAGLGQYVDRLATDGINLDGKHMFTSRAVGFVHRPFFPDGISDNQTGPGALSTSPQNFSPLNNGFQTDYLLQGAKKSQNILAIIFRSATNILTGTKPSAPFCDATNGNAANVLNNTVMIFSGSTPIFKNGQLAGAVGISGDGIDQDDIISAYGTENFEVPPDRRIDRIVVRGVRMPYNKFPRHPHIGEE